MQLLQTLDDAPELRDEVVQATIPFCTEDLDIKRLKYCFKIASDVAAITASGSGIPKLVKDLVNHPEDTFAYIVQVVIPIIIGQTEQGRPIYEENLDKALEILFELDLRSFGELDYQEFEQLVKTRLVGKQIAEII